jgi:hypothetical protein
MDITEEVGRRRQEIRLADAKRAYGELRDLLTRRISADEVHEEKYYNDVDDSQIRSKIVVEEQMDKYTFAIHEIFVDIHRKDRKANIQIKGKLVTEYPTEKKYQQTLWYYAYRALFDKFLYGENRAGHEESVEEKTDTILERLRDNLEEDYSGQV